MKTLSYFLICCLPLLFLTVSNTSIAQSSEVEEISFYQTDLVCGAAPHIGCGSKSKPILLDFEKHEDVKEAWLNREGTVIGVVWSMSIMSDQNEVAANIFKENSQVYEILEGEKHTRLLENFREEGKWYKGIEVDELSMEEMEFIMKGRGFDISSDKSFFSRSCCSTSKNSSVQCSISCSMKSCSFFKKVKD